MLKFKLPIGGRYLIHLSLLYLIASCNINHEQIVIAGTVTDVTTNQPLMDATVIANCMFYDSKLVDYDIEEDTVKTDSAGKFELNFKKGVTVELKIRALGYLEKEYLFNLESNIKYLQIQLESD